MINCYVIEPGTEWLEADLQVKCWDSMHKKWFFTVGVPMLILWVAGLPIVAFVLLFRQRK